MKKTTVMSNCQYTRLALISLLESYQLEVTVGPINYLYFGTSKKSEVSTYIHIDGNDYDSIAEIIKYCQLLKFRDSIFITDPEIMPFFCFLAKCKLEFIDDKLSAEKIKEKIIKKIPGQIIATNDSLTTNEILVMKKLLSGMSLTSVASHTKKSIKTVSSQKISALNKLNIKNSPHSIAKLVRFMSFFIK